MSKTENVFQACFSVRNLHSRESLHGSVLFMNSLWQNFKLLRVTSHQGSSSLRGIKQRLFNFRYKCWRSVQQSRFGEAVWSRMRKMCDHQRLFLNERMGVRVLIGFLSLVLTNVLTLTPTVAPFYFSLWSKYDNTHLFQTTKCTSFFLNQVDFPQLCYKRMKQSHYNHWQNMNYPRYWLSFAKKAPMAQTSSCWIIQEFLPKHLCIH